MTYKAHSFLCLGTGTGATSYDDKKLVMILLEASPSCTPWQRERMWFAGYVPSELSNKPTFLYYIRYTADREIFIVKNISSITKISSMLNINIAELLTLHIL